MGKLSSEENELVSYTVTESDVRYLPSEEFKKQAYFNSHSQYKKIYRYSLENRDKFWSNIAKELQWYKPWSKIKQGKASNAKWFVGAKTNMSYNCLDIHLETNRKNKAAIIWESEDGETRIFTYQLLYTNVCNFANALKKTGIKKGDNILIYMGMIPESVIAMLACARIGAIHSVVHSGMSPAALAKRISPLSPKLIITQDFILKNGSYIPLKENVDKALGENVSVQNVVVFNRYRQDSLKLIPNRDILWQNFVTIAPGDCEAVQLFSQHPVFSLFTNGSKGEPVKILHRTGGYMIQSYLSAKWIYDLKDEDIIWNTSDIAWISSHTYSVYGPLLNGVTTFMYEGSPVHPQPDRIWQLISKYKINIFNTYPSLLKTFSKLGENWVNKHDFKSLRLLGTISESIKSDTWQWFNKLVGNENIPVINSWMQAETGSILLSPMPGAAEMRPGLICYPFPGVEIDIVDISGNSVKEGEGGYLIVKDSWPSMFETGSNDLAETKLNCWEPFKGNYFTGDAAIREKDEFISILGRVDDVIKTAGHRVGGGEIENILMQHKDVREAAVVKRPDEIIGNAIIAFVSLEEDVPETLLLKEELRNFTAEKIGELAKPTELNFMTKLPRLENGKINRRLLRKIALDGTPVLKGKDEENFSILEKLREDYQKIYLS